jgi:hypothetical protein
MHAVLLGYFWKLHNAMYWTDEEAQIDANIFGYFFALAYLILILT